MQRSNQCLSPVICFGDCRPCYVSYAIVIFQTISSLSGRTLLQKKQIGFVKHFQIFGVADESILCWNESSTCILHMCSAMSRNKCTYAVEVHKPKPRCKSSTGWRLFIVLLSIVLPKIHMAYRWPYIAPSGRQMLFGHYLLPKSIFAKMLCCHREFRVSSHRPANISTFPLCKYVWTTECYFLDFLAVNIDS